MLSKSIRLMTVALVLMLPTVSWAQLRPGFGNNWVKTNPFMLNSWAGLMSDFTPFSGTNLNSIMSGSGTPIEAAADNFVPWHFMSNYNPGNDAGYQQAVLDQLSLPNNMGRGWYIKDEPTQDMFAGLGAFASWLKAEPGAQDMLIYAGQLAASAVSDYDQYMTDYMNTVAPDALMYNSYPNLGLGGQDLERHMNDIIATRNKAIQYNVPFFTWVSNIRNRWVGNGESKMRMPVFATLTAGAKGINWFLYESDSSPDAGFVFGDTQTKTNMYDIGAQINSEVANLGQSLRYLDSKSVYYISNSIQPTPSELTNYTSGVEQSQMTGIQITSPSSDFTDGMIGFFEDKNNEQYFMLTNLNFEANDAAVDALNFQLSFDASVDSLLRLNRLTGQEEVVNLTNNTLNVVLPGGTGDLFKYNNGVPFALARALEWTTDVSGDWNVATNWSLGASPNGNDNTAAFGAAITAPQIVFVNSAVTVKSITFGDTNAATIQQSYGIAGFGSVNLDADNGAATIDVLEGAHQFQTVVNLVTDTSVSTAAGTSLTFNNTLNLNGNTLTKTGTGTMTINNQLNTGGGVIAAAAGIVSGSGTLLGDLDNTGATLAPGNSPGTLTIDGDYTHGYDATLSIELGGLLQGVEYDLLDVTGMLTIYGGALEVLLLDGFNPAEGDVFDILNFATIDGVGFDTLSLPTLGNGLSWDTSTFLADGTLLVTSVPEPSCLSILGSGLVICMLVRRRSVHQRGPCRLPSRLMLAVVVLTAIPLRKVISRKKVCFGLVAFLLVAATAQAAIIFEHVGDADPTTEGFSLSGTSGTADPGPPANWSMVATNPSFYSFPINQTDFEDPSGWTLTVTAKLNAASANARSQIRLKDSGNRFEIGLLGTRAYYESAEDVWTQLGPVDPTDGFHTYVIVFDPNGAGTADDTATWYVDGVDRTGPVLRTGIEPNGGAAQAIWGRVSGVGDISDQQYSLVRWETGQNPPPPPATQEWGVKLSGDWNNNLNWFSEAAPDANVTTAIFAGVITAPQVVFTNSAVTVKGVTFGDTNASTIQQSYAISGLGSVNLASDTGTSMVSVLEGSHQFQVVVNLNNATTVTVGNTNASDSLAFNNALNLNGNTLTKTGSGKILINNAQNSGGGSIVFAAGTVGGSGAVGGDLTNNGGTVAPGNSLGTLTVAGNYSQTAGSLAIEIDGSGAGEFDALKVTGNLAVSAGTLDVAFAALPGKFQILDVTGASSLAFGSVNNTGILNVSFDDSLLDSTGELVVNSAMLGDMDGDLTITTADVSLFMQALVDRASYDANGFFVVSADFNGDVDGSNTFDLGDLAAFNAIFSATSASAVPEPGSASLLIVSLIALALVGHRRK